jgi:hypothetical protein
MANDLQSALSDLFGSSAPTQAAPAADTSKAPAPQQDNTVSFTSGPQMAKDSAVAVDRARAADDVLSSFVTTNDQVAQTREANLSKVVAAKKAVSDQVSSEIDGFNQTVTPIFQKREAIAARQTELSQMNPLKRWLLGTVSNQYNDNYLANEQKALTSQLQVHSTDFQTLMGIHDDVVKNLDSVFEGQDSINRLHLENASQDVRLAMQGVGTAQQVLQTEQQGIAANADLIRTQSMARTDLMGSMTPEQVNRAYADATKNGGTTVVNGIPLRAGELKDLGMQWHDKQVTLQSRDLALRANQVELAQTLENQYIGKMSGPEIKAAIANGGKLPNGHMLNQESLTRALAASQQQSTMMADSAVQQSAYGIYANGLKTITAGVQGGLVRAQSLFGTTPDEINRLNNGIAAKLNGISAGAKAAHDAGPEAERAYVAKVLPDIQAIQEAQDKTNKSLADRWSGGDPNLKIIAESWLSGTPVNSESAAKGMIAFARHDIPAGTKLSPGANATIIKVRQIVQQFDGGAAGDSVSAMMAKTTKRAKGEEDPKLVSAVEQAIRGSYNQTTMDSLFQAAPQIARNIVGPDGQPHPFSRVDPADLSAALRHGDEEGLKVLSRKLGLSPDKTKTLFDAGEGGSQWKLYKNQHPDADFGQMARAYNAQQNMATLIALDHSASAKPGFKPSEAYTSLLHNPQFQQQAESLAAAQGGNSPGDYMLHSIAGTHFSSKMFSQADNVAQAQAAIRQRTLQQATETSMKLRNLNPVDSARVALHAIPGLSAPEAELLLQHTIPLANAQSNANGTVSADGYSGAIDSVIQHQKFQDPNLERIRRTAAAAWPQIRPQVNKGIMGLLAAPVDYGNQAFAYIGQGAAQGAQEPK